MVEKKRSVERKGRIIKKQMTAHATPRQVWEAWADPGKISQWFVDGAEGEAKSGGSMTWIFEDFGYRFTYEVLEARPEERLVLTASLPGRSPVLLEIDIEPAGGHTLLKLVQSGFGEGAEWDDEYQDVNSGWDMALAILKHYLENYFGRPRQHATVMLPAEYTPSQLRPFYRKETGLAKWLTRTGAIGEVGTPYQLTLKDGTKISGEVLAGSDTEVQLSCKEIQGAVGLKAFSKETQKMLAIHLLSWGDEDRLSPLKKTVTGALERLKVALAN